MNQYSLQDWMYSVSVLSLFLVPVQRTSLLSEFSFSRSAAIHWLMSSTHSPKVVTAVSAWFTMQEQLGASSIVLRAYTYIPHWCIVGKLHKMYKINSKGPRTDPVALNIQVLQSTNLQFIYKFILTCRTNLRHIKKNYSQNYHNTIP